MTQQNQIISFERGVQTMVGNPAVSIGESFLHALVAQNFDSLEMLYKPVVRFRAIVPSGERLGNTSGESAGWFRKWFGKCDAIQLIQSSAKPVFDRLYISYQLRVHDGVDGWRVIEQHAYGQVQDGQITDMWLICSGFRPDLDFSEKAGVSALQSPQPHLSGDLFYDAGSKGCAEGPMDEIAYRMRQLASGQTLEIHATDPSVGEDLPAWCHLSGHQLVKHVGDNYLIQHK
jgi:TusA-related sulfurtransferase